MPSRIPLTGEIAGFGGDWSLGALAAAGVDAAAVRSGDGPSAQSFYLGLWTTGGDNPWENWIAPSGAPDGRPATDYERALLHAHAGGLQVTRLSAEQNLLAQLAGLYNGPPATPDAPGSAPTEGTFGEPGLFNGTVFGLLALARTEAPPALLERSEQAVRGNQHDDGGWTFQRVTSAAARARPSDIDMTGAGLGALCDAGVPAADAAVQRGVAFLRSQVDPASGGFAHRFGINVDSAAWAVQGLNACGIDPRGEGWAPGGKDPIDFILSLQRANGSFRYTADEGDDQPPNLYASQSAVRALAGGGLGADPPSVREAPAVPAGTVVPQAVVIDAAGDVRFCRVFAPVGAAVLELLQAAPCATGLRTGGGQVLALNGVTADTRERRWLARVDGGAAAVAGPQAVGHGDLVALELGADPSPVPAPDPQPQRPAPQPRPQAPERIEPPIRRAYAATLTARGRRLDRRGRLALSVRCPAAADCRVTLLARATIRGHGRQVARTALLLAAGERRTVRLRVSRAPRGRTLRIRAITRAPDGAIYTRRLSVRPR